MEPTGCPDGIRQVLVVEDDDDSAALLAEYIGRRDCVRVIRAHTGEDAVRIATTTRVDLIFVDLLLPGMTGDRVVTILRAERSTASRPIVVSSVVDRHDYPDCVDGVLPKPYTRREVEGVLNLLLPYSDVK